MSRVIKVLATALLALGGLSVSAQNTTTTTSTSTSEATSGVIVVRGNKLFNAKTGERFILKGMTYEYAVHDDNYEKYSKAIIDKHLADVNLNTLRLYDINPDLSYEKFMTDMAKRGVYVVVGGTPDNNDYYTKYRYATLKKGTGPDEGETCYSPVLLEFGKKVAKNFAKYDNTLAILVGNEVMQKDLTAGACVKQYVADLKTWMRANIKQMRLIPLAYAAADSAYGGHIASAEEYHTLKIQGLLCGDKMEDGTMTRSIDIYLINEYRWCPDASFAVYQQFQNMAQGLPIVIGFGEYGCKLRTDEPRLWQMVPYLYDEPAKTEGFSDLWSGGLAYSFGEAKLPKGSLFPMFSGGSMDPLKEPSSVPSPDFDNLKKLFTEHAIFSQKAEWKDDAKCKWTPEVKTTVSPTNVRATKSGWFVANCDADVLKVIPTDTWITKSRQGVDCDAGTDCDVPMKESVGTTEEDICGEDFIAKVKPAEAGGGSCKKDDDCTGHGKCVEADSIKQCKCDECYSGTNCGLKKTDDACAPADDVSPSPSSAVVSKLSVAIAGTAVALSLFSL
ncbi:hypothetical protein Poli38472_003403 [Pythium oligandrum]|uniref:EGF-like domain-containing protein n=1 Tax=Pythium oligandrum TaxID=41045 RepID=A0A8K1FG57_PYTOL|nr:hypothetical protein Poli38472_003403 [Pythium oligandrum]|eukprot:TMW57478.1 hypothetical protein Poli38472_003403 [Pythium oligandrum]